MPRPALPSTPEAIEAAIVAWLRARNAEARADDEDARIKTGATTADVAEAIGCSESTARRLAMIAHTAKPRRLEWWRNRKRKDVWQPVTRVEPLADLDDAKARRAELLADLAAVDEEIASIERAIASSRPT